MRWKVQLEGPEKELEELSESFGEDPRIFEEDEEYYLWYSEFEQLGKFVDIQNVFQLMEKNHLPERSQHMSTQN